MMKPVLGNLTSCQTKLFHKLQQGVQIRHLTGNSYRLHDPQRRYRKVAIDSRTFAKFFDADLLKIVDRGEYFETYALDVDEAQVASEVVREIPRWINRRNYRPVPLFAVSPAAWREWNDVTGCSFVSKFLPGKSELDGISAKFALIESKRKNGGLP